MKIAYFDCFSGIAGDMTLGALLDCGVPLDELKTALASLRLDNWDIQTTPVLKSGIHGLQVRIEVGGESDDEELARIRHAQAHRHDHHHDYGHSHDHKHSHEHDHEHHHDHEHSHDEHHHEHSHSHDEHQHEHHHHHSHDHEHHHHGRSMAEIRELIENSDLSERVKRHSLQVFGLIARAEAKMHQTTPDEVHFHEIGGVDSIVDIVGACWALEWLGVEKMAFSALPSSTGWVDCAHGRMPVPAPATLEILRGVPMIPTEIKGEMVTPTGAGFVAALGAEFGAMPALTPQIVGCGAGHKNWPDRPNLLRVVIGDAVESSVQTSPQVLADDDLAQKLPGLNWTNLHQIECNIDDMNPEFFAHVMARIFEAGGLDVWITPLQMKKSRPAWQLSALCETNHSSAVLTAILRETTTLGARIQTVQRASLQRTHETVATEFGEVRVKVARWDEANLRRAVPEWDDVQKLAREQNVAAREVYEAASRAAGLQTGQTDTR